MAERANTVRLTPSARQERQLADVADRVSRLWNQANVLCRKRFLSGSHVRLGKALEYDAKGWDSYEDLPSDMAQEVVKKVTEAWRSYFKLRQLWKEDPSAMNKPGLPRYRKDRRRDQRQRDYIPVKTGRSYAIRANSDVSLVLPRNLRSQRRKRLNVSYRGRVMHQGTPGRAAATWDAARRRWYWTWTVRTSAPPQRETGRVAAIDLGVKVLASVSVEGQERAEHYHAREVLKTWDRDGRAIAAEQRRLHAAGMQYPRSRQLKRLHQRRRLRREHGLKTMAKSIAAACRDAGVDTVYVGWPKDVRRDVDYGALQNSRIHSFWSFAKTARILSNALAAEGITCHHVSERGTSSHCPSCGSAKVVRRPRAWLRCRESACGSVIHSEQAGSRNILRQMTARTGSRAHGAQKPSVGWDGPEAGPRARTRTHTWNHHAWWVRAANPGGMADYGDAEFSRAA